MKRKIVALIMVLMMSSLIACGSQPENAQVAQNSTGEASEAEETAEEATDGDNLQSDDSGESQDEVFVGMANPWQEGDKQSMLDATGIELDAPDGAEQVIYRYMTDGTMAELQFNYDGNDWTYRAQPAAEFTDISGMYYEWNEESDGEVSGRAAKFYAYSDASEDAETIDDVNYVMVVNWFDAVPGIMYSLSAEGKDLNGMDIQVYAEDIFVPVQGED